MSWVDLETATERRERNARELARRLDERGYARFPHGDYPPGWDEDRLREARRDLFQAIEDLADTRGDVQFYELDGALIVEWAPPETP
jgi:hypothetical protein